MRNILHENDTGPAPAHNGIKSPVAWTLALSWLFHAPLPCLAPLPASCERVPSHV